MARKSTTRSAAGDVRSESIGQRLARLRKQKGLTQVQLAEKIGTIQAHISAYELDRIRPNSDMIIQFSKILGASADEILGLNNSKGDPYKPSLKISRRMRKIEGLRTSQQKFVLKAIDALLKDS